MTLTDEEVTASLVMLVCMAKADGVLHDDERSALQGALEGMDLPEGMTLDTLLEEDLDIEDYLGDVTRDEAKQAIYRSTYSMAYADGECSPDEQAMLDRIRETFGISAEETTSVQRLFQASDEDRAKAYVKPITDPEQRDATIRKETLKCAIVSAVLGAFPIPGLAIATDLAVVGLQITLIRDIGQYWGKDIDKDGARSLLYGLGLGTGARLAVSNLAKLLPGWGSVVGATTSFASTYALGGVMNKFFGAEDATDIQALKGDFKAAEQEGKKVYKENQSAIDAKAKEAKAVLDELNGKLESGAITQAEYESQVAELA